MFISYCLLSSCLLLIPNLGFYITTILIVIIILWHQDITPSVGLALLVMLSTVFGSHLWLTDFTTAIIYSLRLAALWLVTQLLINYLTILELQRCLNFFIGWLPYGIGLNTSLAITLTLRFTYLLYASFNRVKLAEHTRGRKLTLAQQWSIVINNALTMTEDFARALILRKPVFLANR